MNDFTLASFLQLLKKHLTAIIASAIVFALVALVVCQFLVTPSYTATGSVLVTNGAIINSNDTQKSSVSGTDISASLTLAYTIRDILKTTEIFKKLSTNLGDKYTSEELMHMVKVERRSDNSLFIDISFSADTPDEAISIVNEYLAIAPEYIASFVPNSTAAVTTTADTAQKTSPKTTMLTLLMFVVGAACAFIVVYIINNLDDTIKDEEDFAARFNVPIIGSVPDFSSASTTSKRSR